MLTMYIGILLLEKMRMRIRMRMSMLMLTSIWKCKVPNYITKLTSKISHNYYVDFVYWVSFIWNIPIHSVQSIHANLLNSFHLNVTFIIQLIHGVITLFNSFQSISFKVNIKSNVNINMKVQSSQLYYKVGIKNIP